MFPRRIFWNTGLQHIYDNGVGPDGSISSLTFGMLMTYLLLWLWGNEFHRGCHQCHSQDLSKVSGALFHLMSCGRTSCCTARNNGWPRSIWLWALYFCLFNHCTHVFFLAIPRLCYASSLSAPPYPYYSLYLSCVPYPS